MALAEKKELPHKGKYFEEAEKIRSYEGKRST